MNKTLRFPAWKITLILVVCFGAIFQISPAITHALLGQGAQSFDRFLPEKRVNLGLDLLGGSHLLLEVDTQSYMDEQLMSLRGAIRAELRERQIGYTTLVVEGGQVQVHVRGETIPDETNIRAVLRQAASGLEVETAGDNRFTVAYTSETLAAKQSQLIAQTIEIISRRIDETGTREPLVQRQGDDRILLQVPGLENPDELKLLLGTTAKMTFHLVNQKVKEDDLYKKNVPLDTIIVPSKQREDEIVRPYALFREAALSGESLVDANMTIDRGQPVVSFRFDTTGARIFGDITRQNTGKQFAIVLDGEVVTAPVINTPILGGSGIIEGGFTNASAEALALLLRAGALPADVTILEERSVGPSLGADSIAAGKMAAFVAIVLVAIFMVLSYGVFGLFSNVALLMNIVLLFAALSLLQATLTLPGIAGIVLTLGMAVDANVLIFERIREESRRGKTVHAAVAKGFDSAFATIIDSNITTLITSCVLFYFGSGMIKGFAVTLSFGILASMFSAILLTRLMIVLWLKRTSRSQLPI